MTTRQTDGGQDVKIQIPNECQITTRQTYGGQDVKTQNK